MLSQMEVGSLNRLKEYIGIAWATVLIRTSLPAFEIVFSFHPITLLVIFSCKSLKVLTFDLPVAIGSPRYLSHSVITLAPNSCLICSFTSGVVFVERENFRPITSWHVILPSPQNTANYKALRTATRFCYYYSEANRNLSSVMQKPITHQCTCKQWHKQPRTCKWWHKQSHTCKWWHKQSSTCKRWHKQTNQAVTCVTNQTRHVSFTHPQTPINKSLPKTFKGTRIQKWKSSARIKPQSLQEHQELQPRNRRTFEAESSKTSA